VVQYNANVNMVQCNTNVNVVQYNTNINVVQYNANVNVVQYNTHVNVVTKSHQLICRNFQDMQRDELYVIIEIKKLKMKSPFQ
jgi:tetrahydromethanopterin S-methyltransferase subunit F